MEKAKQAIEQAKKELGINYKKINIENIQVKNIKKIIEKNPAYSLSNAKLLDEEYDTVYQYYGEYEAIIQDGNVLVEETIIGNVKEGNKKKLEGKKVDCTIYGGNYKTITKKDDDPNKVVIHHSDLYKVLLEMKIN